MERNRQNRILAVICVVLSIAFAGLLIFNHLPNQRISRYIKQGDQYLEEGDYDNAILSYQSAVSIAPNSAKTAKAQQQLADAYVYKADEILNAEGETVTEEQEKEAANLLEGAANQYQTLADLMEIMGVSASELQEMYSKISDTKEKQIAVLEEEDASETESEEVSRLKDEKETADQRAEQLKDESEAEDENQSVVNENNEISENEERDSAEYKIITDNDYISGWTLDYETEITKYVEDSEEGTLFMAYIFLDEDDYGELAVYNSETGLVNVNSNSGESLPKECMDVSYIEKENLIRCIDTEQSANDVYSINESGEFETIYHDDQGDDNSELKAVFDPDKAIRISPSSIDFYPAEDFEKMNPVYSSEGELETSDGSDSQNQDSIVNQLYYRFDGASNTLYLRHDAENGYEQQQLPRTGFWDWWGRSDSSAGSILSKVTRIVLENKIVLSDPSGLFAGAENLKEIENLSNLSLDRTENLSYLFYRCSSLTELDLSGLKTDTITDMSHMFDGCSSLNELQLSGLNTENVFDMCRMFAGCKNLQWVDLPFHTENVTDFSEMFANCKLLTSINFYGFKTDNAVTLRNMFRNCKKLQTLDLSEFNTENVTDMSALFYGCKSLTSINLSSFDTEQAVDMSEMFRGCAKISSLDLSSFNTKNAADMRHMFSGCKNLVSLDLSSFNTKGLVDMSDMFNSCEYLVELNLSSFSTEDAADMSGAFAYCYNLTDLEVNLNRFIISETCDIENILLECPENALTSYIEEVKAGRGAGAAWKNEYASIIEKNRISSEKEGKDPAQYQLIYVDDDSVPELLELLSDESVSAVLYSYRPELYGTYVYKIYGIFSYQEGTGRFRDQRYPAFNLIYDLASGLDPVYQDGLGNDNSDLGNLFDYTNASVINIGGDGLLPADKAKKQIKKFKYEEPVVEEAEGMSEDEQQNTDVQNMAAWKNLLINELTTLEANANESYHNYYYKLIHLDSDGIPEVLIQGWSTSNPFQLLSLQNNTIVYPENTFGGLYCSYIEGTGMVRFYKTLFDDYDVVYKLEGGTFNRVYFNMFIDDSYASSQGFDTAQAQTFSEGSYDGFIGYSDIISAIQNF